MKLLQTFASAFFASVLVCFPVSAIAQQDPEEDPPIQGRPSPVEMKEKAMDPGDDGKEKMGLVIEEKPLQI